MKCDVCQSEDATVHLTQVLDGSVKKLHLCASCAGESGVDVHSPVSIADLFIGLNKKQRSERVAGAPVCPRCHLKPADFKKSGRLGCPECYIVFAESLAPLIRAMQRGDQHAGRTPGETGPVKARDVSSEELKQKLDRAIAAERFEEAAQLRDQLAALKPDRTDPVPQRQEASS